MKGMAPREILMKPHLNTLTRKGLTANYWKGFHQRQIWSKEAHEQVDGLLKELAYR